MRVRVVVLEGLEPSYEAHEGDDDPGGDQVTDPGASERQRIVDHDGQPPARQPDRGSDRQRPKGWPSTRRDACIAISPSLGRQSAASGRVPLSGSPPTRRSKTSTARPRRRRSVARCPSCHGHHPQASSDPEERTIAIRTGLNALRGDLDRVEAAIDLGPGCPSATPSPLGP